MRLDEMIKRLNDIESEEFQDWKPGDISKGTEGEINKGN